jgi:hypothetical protein
MQKREGFRASLICYHARLVKVKNVSVGISERQALSNLIRFSRSRDPSIKYDSLSTLMSKVDVIDSLARLEHCRDAPLFSAISDCRSGNRFKRLLSCPGMGKLLEWFLPFLATVASETQKTVALLRWRRAAYTNSIRVLQADRSLASPKLFHLQPYQISSKVRALER